MPSRLVSSAKSWLCHDGVDRSAAILPAGDDVPRRISPIDATAAYLAHLRDAWNATVGARERLEKQELYLTVPASFDAAARELTVRAAREAGLGEAVLLEEPQAACYAWIAASGDAWRTQVRIGDTFAESPAARAYAVSIDVCVAATSSEWMPWLTPTITFPAAIRR